MNLSKDDPKLTAYVLNEIDDPEERAQIEAAIAASEELQSAVAEIRELTSLLNEGLAGEPRPELSEFDKARLSQPATSRSTATPSPLARFVSLPIVATLAAAAAVLLVFVALPPYGAMDGPPTEVEQVRAKPQLEAPPPPAVAGRRADKEEAVEGELADTDEVFSLTPFEVVPTENRAEPAGEPAEKKVLSQLELSMSPQVGYAQPAVSADFATARMQASPPVSYREREESWNTEGYDPIEETGFRSPLVAPLSTFSIDVDTASYANVRRFLNQGQLPPADAVRIEELINYFPYDDAPPTRSLDEGGEPFAVHMDLTTAPWDTGHQLLRIGLKGYEMPWEERPASNLVFLLDVSGSMNSPNKLPLVKDAMRLLVDRLDARDRVAIVVYAGASGLVLPSTTANNRETISHAIHNLAAGGSTNAGAGIELAYKVARDHFIKGGNNRVILCTDGDFNVGQTNRGDLSDIASGQAEAGVSLTILGFGMGNYKDDMLESLSNKGKGSYAYIDSQSEAEKVFLEEIASNLFKIAKDVKIQVEFNPAHVGAYRLIGYENRRLKAEDFNDDRKKAGDIGPGHSVVALYEIVPPESDMDLPTVDPLKYQDTPSAGSRSDELATVKLRYKQPEGETSRLISRTVTTSDQRPLTSASADVRFAAAVAAFGMRLSGSELLGEFGWNSIEELARTSMGGDAGHHRSEFLQLIRKARDLKDPQVPIEPRPEERPRD